MNRSREGLLRWQWNGYANFHRDPRNLWIHVLAVPLFIAAVGGLAFGTVRLSWPLGAVSIAALAVAIVLQGRGHAREEVPPEPFLGPVDFVRRIVAEQFVTFPRFVISGGWRQSLRAVNTPCRVGTAGGRARVG
jgi:hypothetical protein